MAASGSGDKSSVADTVKKLINNHKVVVFSKSYCMLNVEIFQ